MMGNIGLTKSGVVLENQEQKQKKKFKDNIALELDIEKVLGKTDYDEIGDSAPKLNKLDTNKDSNMDIKMNKEKAIAVSYVSEPEDSRE